MGPGLAFRMLVFGNSGPTAYKTTALNAQNSVANDTVKLGSNQGQMAMHNNEFHAYSTLLSTRFYGSKGQNSMANSTMKNA